MKYSKIGPFKVTQETVEKGHLIFVTAFSGVMLPFPSKRFSIVDRIRKPLFLVP
jgi:hypothetical protein